MFEDMFQCVAGLRDTNISKEHYGVILLDAFFYYQRCKYIEFLIIL